MIVGRVYNNGVALPAAYDCVSHVPVKTKMTGACAVFFDAGKTD